MMGGSETPSSVSRRSNDEKYGCRSRELARLKSNARVATKRGNLLVVGDVNDPRSRDEVEREDAVDAALEDREDDGLHLLVLGMG